MRYYDLRISSPDGSKVWAPTPKGNGFTQSSKAKTTFTSHDGNTLIPGALNIEFDVPTIPFNTPQGAAMVRVQGIGLGMISQASQLAGQSIRLMAGMKKGLPLATTAAPFAGTILEGTIYQAFGNWQGNDQTLEIICYPEAAQKDQDISFYWPAGMSLATALATVFVQAFGSLKMQTKIKIADLSMPADGSGHYTLLSDLADYIQQISQKLGAQQFGDDYSGVLITIVGNTIFAYDSENPLPTITLNFRDLIGQPTWIGPNTINFKTVMRSDITNGSVIKLPEKGLVTPYVLTSQAAAVPNQPIQAKAAFQGTFLANEVHQFGNYRQPDADSWVTTINAVSQATASS